MPPGHLAVRGTGVLPSLLGSSLWDLRALFLVFCHKSSWPGPPWGSPRPLLVPLCPVVPTLPTGRQRGAVCISRQRESAARPWPGRCVGRARGGRQRSLRVPRGRSVPPVSFVVTVAGAARRDRGFARGERPAGPGTRGVRKAWRVCVGTRSPQGERGAGAPCGEAQGRRWRWLLVGHPALSGQGRGPSEETGRGHASGAWPRGCWEPQKRLSRAGAWLVWFSLKLRRRPGGLGCRGGRWAAPLFGEGPQGARE